MLEKALSGKRGYWLWVGSLLAMMGAGAYCYMLQLQNGLSISGLSRDVTGASTSRSSPSWWALRHRP